MSEPNRFQKAANQIGQAWEMATTGKYSTWNNPVSIVDRVSHVVHRLTDAAQCVFIGQTRVEAMHSEMADDLQEMADVFKAADPKAPKSAPPAPPQ